MMKKIKMLLKGEITLSEIISYLEGNIRYRLFFSPTFNSLIRKHILSQIEYRIKVMNPECWDKGSCIKCGCEVPALQMASRSCEGDCYPPLMGKEQWNNKEMMMESPGRKWFYNAHIKKYVLYTETSTSYVRVNKQEFGDYSSEERSHGGVSL